MLLKNLALTLSAACVLVACGGEGSSSAQESNVMTTASSATLSWPELAAPVAQQKPKEITQHGNTRVDNYAWMRDDNWQEVLKDPSLLQADIREHLEDELAYYQAMTADLQPLRETLFAEMRGRIKEDDSSVPMRDGAYEYYRRYREGGEYPIYARRRLSDDGAQGAEEILFDGDAEKGDSEFFSVAAVSHSPDHEWLAIATDRVGSERMVVEVRSAGDAKPSGDVVTDVYGGAVWAADSKSFFYTVRESNGMPKRVMHHVLGTDAATDRLVYEERDPEFNAFVQKSQSGEFILITTGNYTSGETWIIPADAPNTEPRLFAPRMPDVEYSLDHRGEYWYIRTNYGDAVDFQLMRAPLDASSPEQWEVFEPYRQGRLISEFVTYQDYIVWSERENARIAIVISDYAGASKRISFDQPAFSADFSAGYEFDTDTLRIAYESPSQPEQIFDVDMNTGERTLLKEAAVPSGHNPDLYTVEMLTASADDGAEIPVMVLRLKSTPLDGTAPVLLNGYGSYGYFVPNYFSTTVLSLVDRGAIFARAHIRGGSAKGEQWYLDGKLAKKKNSFSDFVRAGEMLAERGYTREGNIVSYGGSAGGLLVGAALNLKPELFRGVLAAVPFVDVINTISDDSLPLTPPEWKEWGNPIESAEQFDWIAEYSPYDNIRAGVAYPPVLATGGLTDYRVTYWEPAKWVARLREQTTGGPILMRMNMAAGHAGSAARFEALDEYSHLYAFALKLMQLDQAVPVSHVE